jgi:hypothetical protein
MRKVYAVWLHYPDFQERRLSALFSSREEADKYAVIPEDQQKSLGYTTKVTAEPVYKLAEDVS